MLCGVLMLVFWFNSFTCCFTGVLFWFVSWLFCVLFYWMFAWNALAGLFACVCFAVVYLLFMIDWLVSCCLVAVSYDLELVFCLMYCLFCFVCGGLFLGGWVGLFIKYGWVNDCDLVVDCLWVSWGLWLIIL